MLAKRIIACLDCIDGRVIKGVQFQNHEDIGDASELAQLYSALNIDELVLYNIASSADGKTVSHEWIRNISKNINIPFCVAGGIRTIQDADKILNNGADKISINTPALENPSIINELVRLFGSQAIVIGVDVKESDGVYRIYKNTGRPEKTLAMDSNLFDWITQVQDRGAGEIVINSISSDGMRNGYNTELLSKLREITRVPLIASGGAGTMNHFLDVFIQSNVDGALAASVFHKKIIDVQNLKKFLSQNNIPIRL